MDYNEWFEHVHGSRPNESNHSRTGKYYEKRSSQIRDAGYDSREENFQLPEIKSGMEKRQVSKSNLHSGIGKGTAYLSKISKIPRPPADDFKSIEYKPSKIQYESEEPAVDFTTAPNI